MEYRSIADIYTANEKIRGQLSEMLNSISADEAAALPDGEKWSISGIVEHLSMVGIGVSRICSKLVDSAKAEGKPSDGTFVLTDNFGERAVEIAGIKLDAPDRVHPTGDVSIGESLQRLEAAGHAISSMRPELEGLDLTDHKFPHPAFGDLTAAEWLVMLGWHEQRHMKQIETMLEKIRQ